ncbi:unnamed protein product, partial [Oppiella nova]
MSKVEVLFVRHLSADCTEDMIKNIFALKSPPKINVQKVKKLKNYAFVHYFNREDAELALQTLSKSDLRSTGLTDEGQHLEITWAKPPNLVNNFQRRKKRFFGSGNCGGDGIGINVKTNPFSPHNGQLMSSGMSPQFEYNNNSSKHLTPNFYSSLMSGDSNNWNNVRNSPTVLMPGLRHNSRNNGTANGNTTPVWYSFENQYPWLPIPVVRSPQTIGVFRSPQPYG